MDWKTFLKDVSASLHDSGHLKEEYNNGDNGNSWLGYLGATETQIAQREDELQVTLPPSYKEFLLASNGFKQVSNFIWDILPVENITWLKDFDNDFYQGYAAEIKYDDVSDEDYFTYGPAQDTVHFRAEYLCNSLVISNWGDAAILLLNPAVKFGKEWEAWMYANWYPGAVRYKSFEALMQSIHAKYL